MARYEKNTPRKTEGVFAYPEYKKPVGRLSLAELQGLGTAPAKHPVISSLST